MNGKRGEMVPRVHSRCKFGFVRAGTGDVWINGPEVVTPLKGRDLLSCSFGAVTANMLVRARTSDMAVIGMREIEGPSNHGDWQAPRVVFKQGRLYIFSPIRGMMLGVKVHQ